MILTCKLLLVKSFKIRQNILQTTLLCRNKHESMKKIQNMRYYNIKVMFILLRCNYRLRLWQNRRNRSKSRSKQYA